MKPLFPDCRVCAITAGATLEEHSKAAKLALEGGVRFLQFRPKARCGGLLGTTSERIAIAQKISGYCKQYGALFVVNDEIGVAKAAGAGVHLGQGDASIEAARKVLGNAVIGVSAHSVGEALNAARKGADYLGLGTVFPTSSKNDANSIIGLAGVRCVRRVFDGDKITIPIIAIGGINAGNAAGVINAGADGVAVISAVCGQRDVVKAAREMLAAAKAR